jgi:hypothetical protein
MKSTNVGVKLDGQKGFERFGTLDYVRSKYDGLTEREQRTVLHPFFQISLQQGRRVYE